jgi:hypothetical protein
MKLERERERERESKIRETDKHSRFVTLKDIVLNDYEEKEVKGKTIKEGNIYAFYPRYIKKLKKENEFCLKEVCEINKHSKSETSKEFIDLLEYVEISDLKEEEIIGELDEKKS